MSGAGRDVEKVSLAKLTKADYKKKTPQSTGKSSLPRGKDPGKTGGVSNGQAVSVVRQSLEAPQIIANLHPEVKGVYEGLVDLVRSIEDGRKVLGLPNAVSESNLINALFRAGIDQHTQTVNGVKILSNRKAGNASGYRVANGSTTRVSTHPAEAEYFIQNKTDKNVSFVIKKPSVQKAFSPNDRANVLEIVFNRNSLKNNPEDMARIVHDIARFVATGEYNDTIGAAHYNYSGSKEFMADAMRSLIVDAEMREDAATVKEIQKDAKRRNIELNLGQVHGGAVKPNRGGNGGDDSLFVARRARVAEDAGRGENVAGSIEASNELAYQVPTPIQNVGRSIRRLSLPISELEFLRKQLSGNNVPAHVSDRIPGGRNAAHTKSGKLVIAADVFGMVDKTDMKAEKDNLLLHGFFLNEDPTWCLNHTNYEIRAERKRSESQLATQFLALADRRTKGLAAGGESTARGIFADELAKIVMDLPNVQIRTVVDETEYLLERGEW